MSSTNTNKYEEAWKDLMHALKYAADVHVDEAFVTSVQNKSDLKNFLRNLEWASEFEHNHKRLIERIKNRSPNDWI